MLVGVAWALVGLVGSCRVSEYACRNGRCVPLDSYCNGNNDCTDNSDEPKYCTVCNRTYYGDVGRTYTLSPVKPKENRYPYLCHLTFTANGHENGDIIQLVLERFHLGRLESGWCKDGYLQVTELGRPLTEGGWCGESPGPAPYFGESTTLTLTIRLTDPSPFQLKLKYRMLRGGEAVARVGPPGLPMERGSLVAGSYCGRTYDECHRSACVLQSPNYPGIYPRNVTCVYTVRQRVVPTCKHAMVLVKHNHLRLPRAGASNKTRECGPRDDKLVFQDGLGPGAARLAVYCGGGPLPRIVSSGPTLLVTFTSSPYSLPLTDLSSPLHGFQLQLQVVFSDSDSLEYVRNNRCDFILNGTDGGRRQGEVHSPKHTLAPRTTCLYRFVGLPTDRIWIYFKSYTLHPRSGNATSNCTDRLKIYTGSRVLENSCEAPRLCDHSSLRNLTRETRPCSPAESYVASSKLFLEYTSLEGTAARPVSFRFRYEFVDTRLGGEPAKGRCSRVFRRLKAGVVHSPRNVFMFGRGGARNLSCSYRVEAAVGDRVRLSIHNASFGRGTECRAGADRHTSRPVCLRAGRSVELAVADAPWRDVVLPRACYCDNSLVGRTSVGPTVFLSSGRSLLLTFSVTEFNVTEDFSDVYFWASFESVRWSECSRRQRVRGSGGEIALAWPPRDRLDMACQGLPWLVEAQRNRSLFLLTWGSFLPLNSTSDNCPTTNRVLLYSGSPLRLMRVVCPSDVKDKEFAVHVFSEEWFGGSWSGAPWFLVEFVGREAGTAALSWLEISRPRAGGLAANASSACRHRCPELDACISASLYCDGTAHCPSGWDEVGCSLATRVTALVAAHATALIVGSSAVLLTLLLGVVLLVSRCARPAAPKRLPTADQLLLSSSSTLSS